MTRQNTMARSSSIWKILLLGTLAHVSLVQAQQTTTPSSAPPRLEQVEEGSDTPITTVTPQERGAKQKIVERRQNGQVTEVQVTTGKSSYTMKPNPPSTISQPGDPASGTLRPPQWKVLEFDLFTKKKSKEGEEAEAAAAAAPPPPPPPSAK
jgi:hypothetical protein